MNDEEKIAHVLVKEQKRVGIIWLLPIIAAVIGAWLLYKSLVNAPIMITVEFDTGDGIKAGHTQVQYEGISVGIVQDVEINEGLKGVTATIAMDKRSKAFLNTGTIFWLVQPEVTLSGIRGLRTLFTGNYVGVRPGEGKHAVHYKALKSAPPIGHDAPGLNVIVYADDLGSVHDGSPVLYKKMLAGNVQDYQLSADGKTVEVKLHIKKEFAHLVKKTTRFWNASGVSVKANLSGVEVQVESIASLIVGGIAFSTIDDDPDSPDEVNPPVAAEGERFKLYKDWRDAKTGIPVVIWFSSGKRLKPGQTHVIYKGIEVASLERVHYDAKKDKVAGHFTFHPEFSGILVEGTRFWWVSPLIGNAFRDGLDSLLDGGYINYEVGDGKKPVFEFSGLNSAPALNHRAQGLHLKLISDKVRSIKRGQKVYYRSVPVGIVQNFDFDKKYKNIIVGITIKPRYEHLVNTNTQFWNASGVSVSASFSGGIHFDMESVGSLLSGGIAFHTPPEAGPGSKVDDGDSFTLHSDYLNAQLGEGVPIEIGFDSGQGLTEGSEIKYHDIKVGEVTSVKLNKKMDGVVVKASLLPFAVELARAGSQFWVAKPEVGFGGVHNLGALIDHYIEVSPGSGDMTYNFTGLKDAPARKRGADGLTLVLESQNLGSVKKGVKVYYREVVVGEVRGTRLAPTSDKVLIQIHIDKSYAPLVRENTRFWNASGITVDFSLFKGAKIHTESLESIVIGGIAFATPDNGEMGGSVPDYAVFKMHKEVKDHWLKWAPQIDLE